MKLTLGIAVLSLILGCASYNASDKPSLALYKVEQLRVGTSKEAETVALLGSPNQIDSNSSEIIWRYKDFNDGTEVLTIGFDSASLKLIWKLWNPKSTDNESKIENIFLRYPKLNVAPTPVEQENPHSWNSEVYYRDDNIDHQFALFNTQRSRVVSIGWYDPTTRQTANETTKKKMNFTIGGK